MYFLLLTMFSCLLLNANLIASKLNDNSIPTGFNDTEYSTKLLTKLLSINTCRFFLKFDTVTHYDTA